MYYIQRHIRNIATISKIKDIALFIFISICGVYNLEEGGGGKLPDWKGGIHPFWFMAYIIAHPESVLNFRYA